MSIFHDFFMILHDLSKWLSNKSDLHIDPEGLGAHLNSPVGRQTGFHVHVSKIW